MTKMTSAEINELDQAIENITHDLRYEHRAIQIVRAVNNHESLVAALEGLIALGCDDRDDMVMQNAVAVLKLAKGA